MKTTFSKLLTILLAIALSNCDGSEGDGVSANQHLAGDTDEGKSYYIAEAEVVLEEVQGTLDIASCITDNTIIYYPSGLYEENEGRSKCDPSDPPGIRASWSLNTDETALFIDFGNNDVEQWNIESINSLEHRLSKPSSDGTIKYVLRRLD